MLNDLPLHPGLVHLPVGLAVALPFVALVLAAWIWRERVPRRAWAVVVLLQALVLVGCLAAERTGEEDAKRVANIVGRERVHEHEERAEVFTFASGALLVLALLVLVVPAGRATRPLLLVSLVGTLAGAGLAVWTGHAGGTIVHGEAGLTPASRGADLTPDPAQAVHGVGEGEDDEDSDD